VTVTMKPDQLDGMRARHVRSESAPKSSPRVCLSCWQPWPCDAQVLLDLIKPEYDLSGMMMRCGDVEHPLTRYDQDRADVLFARGRLALEAGGEVRCLPEDYHMLVGSRRVSFTMAFPTLTLTCDPTYEETR
jgi:hypothetical protein